MLLAPFVGTSSYVQQYLTPPALEVRLPMMSSNRPILMVVVAFALATYAADCTAMTTPEQSMRCCNSMPCSPQGHHGQDCCKKMPSMHAPFGQPSSVLPASFASTVFAVLPTSGESLGIDSSVRLVAAQSHAPPIFYDTAPTPLRI